MVLKIGNSSSFFFAVHTKGESNGAILSCGLKGTIFQIFRPIGFINSGIFPMQ